MPSESPTPSPATLPPDEPGSVRRALLRAVALPIVLSLANALVLIYGIRTVIDSAQWVDHTDEVISAVNLEQRVVSDAESALRGYLLTGDPSLLDAYHRTGLGVRPASDALIALVRDNPEQQRAAREMYSHWLDWDALARERIARRAQTSTEQFAADMHDGLSHTDALRALAGRFVASESVLRAEREARTARVTRLTIGTVLLLLVLLGVSIIAITRNEFRNVAERYAIALHDARTKASALSLSELRAREAAAAAESARAEAVEANRLKDEFLATLSHELRTPLTAVLGWTRLLATTPSDAARLSRGLATIERNARHQAQLVEDLLDVSSIAAGKLRLELRPTEVSGVVRVAVDTVSPAAQAKGVEVSTEFTGEPCVVAADPVRLQQMVWNLVSNALKFTPAGGRVDVSLARENADVVLRVRDTGEGIAPEFLPHVFDRFRQAEASTDRVHGGLGLGLAIVRQLAELHGGRVSAQSEGVGRGATFQLTLPALASQSDDLALSPGA